MRLTDKAVKATKPREKTYRIFDGEGLYLEVTPKGGKYWRMKCRFNGKEDRLAFGVYPKTSLSEARQKRQEAQDALKAGKNPRYAAGQKAGMTFRQVAMEWFNARKGGWTGRYAATVLHRLETDVFPRLGNNAIAGIETQDVLGVIRPVCGRGASEKAKRLLRYINAIFNFGIVTIGDMRYSPAVGLHVAIPTKPVKHNPHLSERGLPEFLKRLNEYQGSPVVLRATRFLLLTMTRTGEVRFAKWSEINEQERLWEIPAERMKMRRPHCVPLSRQALAILEHMKEFGHDDNNYIFPSPIRRGRPLSENTILYALYDMGYRGKLTGHGFRATASTILNERGYPTLAIERQLAHVDKNKVRASYNHAEFMTERREILQAWADLLDTLQTV